MVQVYGVSVHLCGLERVTSILQGYLPLELRTGTGVLPLEVRSQTELVVGECYDVHVKSIYQHQVPGEKVRLITRMI